MKKLQVTNYEKMKELSHDELINITGEGIGSFVLGSTIFGMARLCGLLAGYYSL